MALNEYAGTAQQAFELMAPVVGRSSEDEWANYVFPLRQAIKRNEPLSELDWAAVLDRGRLRQRPGRLGFGRRADEFWIVELRSLQDKISNYHRYTVLRDNAAYPPATRSPSSSDTPGLSHF